jgi:hypothetical protein
MTIDIGPAFLKANKLLMSVSVVRIVYWVRWKWGVRVRVKLRRLG